MLISHNYSGQLAKHHQTSYAVLVLIAVLVGIFMLGISGVAQAGPTVYKSGTVNVFATVPGIPPATAPVITSPVGGAHFDSIPISVSGTCMTGFIVKVFRNGVFSGADMCSGGLFHLSIDLFDGTNNLTAKHFNYADQGGPVSATVTVYYNRITPTPTPSPSPTPSSGPTLEPSPSAGPYSPQPSEIPVVTPTYISQLVLMSDTAYHGLFLGEEIKWPVEIKNGLAPYAISWDWGDGKTDLISQNAAGTFIGAHGYSKSGQYRIIINATDIRGETAHLELVMVVHEGVGVAATSQPASWLDRVLPIIWPIYALICLIILSFWFGEVRARRMLMSELATGQMV